MSMRRTPAPHAGRGGGGGGGALGVYTGGEGRTGGTVTEAARRELRQLGSVQADVRAVTARLEHVEDSVRKGVGAGSDAKQAAKREHLRPLPHQEHLQRVQASQSSACSTSLKAPRGTS